MFKPLCLFIALLLALPPALHAQGPARVAPQQGTAHEDGPYVIWNGKEALVYRVRQGRVEKEIHRGPFLLELPAITEPGLALSPAAIEPAQAEFEAPEKILALSDIHGRLDSARRLLQAHRVVDEKGRWTFGRGHLVIVGDTMDRGPQVTEAYWFFRALEAQAHQARGRVHLLLGNHEFIVLGGTYLHYLHPKYAHPPAGLPPLATLYGPNSEIGRWLRSRPTLLRLGPFLFVHGGISPAFLSWGMDLPQANHLIRKAIGFKSIPGTASHFLINEDGPLWYSGFLPRVPPRSSDQDIDRALTLLRSKAFVVGHMTLNHITSLHGGRVYAIDAGIKEGKASEAWLWEGGKVYRALADGRREAVPSR